MARLRVRHEILQAVAMFMLEKGKVLSKHEYDQLAQEVPLRTGMVLNHFGSWSRLLSVIENDLPDVWKEIKKAEAPPPPPPPPPKPEDPLAKLAKTSSVKEEKKDE